METDIQREARALGDPTRYRLFCYIVDASGPVGVGELTDYVRLNHNAIRQHLAVLKDAELVVEEVEDRDRPGRPRLLYHLHPEAAGRWGTPGAYAWLASLLSDAIRRKQAPRRRAAKTGIVGRPTSQARAIVLICSKRRWLGEAFVRLGWNEAAGSTSCSAVARSPRSRVPTLTRSASSTSVWPRG